MLREIDEAISYEEEVMDPVSILGHPVNEGIYSAAFGVVIAGLAVAIERFVSVNGLASYDKSGWFNAGLFEKHSSENGD